MLIDNIFGTQIEPGQRVANHQLDLAGVKHLQRLEPLNPVPGQPITVTLTTSGPRPFTAAAAWYATEPPAGSAAAPRGAVAAGRIDLQRARVTWDTVIWGYVQHWTGQLPPQPAGSMLRYQLAARAAEDTERWVYADNQAESAAAGTEFAVWIDEGAAPEWARAAMVYHVFIDRFYPGDGRPWLKPANLSGFFGGTLRGVIQKLDYIQGLGFNAIWLSPVFASPSHHGYDATDLYTVEPRLGTNADLQELMAAAHARGLRVILDFVANHWSNQHASFQAAQSDPNSPYHDWYTWLHWPDDYVTYFGVKELPQLNLARGPARDYLLAAAQYWLRQGADGFRLDYASGPPHDFWADFQRACRLARPDCWLFGEIINTPSVQRSYAGRLDGTLDFLLASALRETFARGAWNLARFEAFLSAHEAFFPPDFIRPAFLDNHDMNRIIFMAGGDARRVRLAALMLFTLSGPPIVYYGTEVGLSQERPIHQNDFGIFEEARLPMPWAPGVDSVALRDTFQRLLALRSQYPASVSGTRRLVHLDAAAGTYAYLREGPGRPVLMALNLGQAACALSLDLAGFTPEARDRLGQAAVQVEPSQVTVSLPGLGGAWIA